MAERCQKSSTEADHENFSSIMGIFWRSREFFGALAESDICEPYIGLVRMSAYTAKWGSQMTKMETPSDVTIIFAAVAGPSGENRTLRPAG
jgi:hypothetical protein